MPDRTLPFWARTVGRVLRTSAGLLAALVGLGDLLSPTPVVIEAAGYPVVRVWSVVLLVFGLCNIVSVIWYKWRWELVFSAVLATALATRAGAVWLTVDDGQRIGAAAGMSLASLLFLLRVMDLTHFAVKTSNVVRRWRKYQ